MKSLKNWRLLLALFLAMAIAQSCEKDELPIDQGSVTDTTGTDTGTGTDNGDGNPDTGGNTGTDNGGDTSGDGDGAQGDAGSITLYTVNGDNISKVTDYKVSGKELEFQKDTQKHQEIWELVKKIIPLNHRSKMSRFMIFAGEGDGTAGYVYNTSQDLSKWEMGIAIDFAYQGGFNAGGELAYTIIHEFGHILTLDNTQVDASISEANCNNFFTGEGCAKTESYINKLYTRFWADIWGEFTNLGQSQSAQEAFYNKYQDRFVTGYASTNPGEDIAEVFATFVTRNGGPSGNSIAEQKIQLMYDHPELISLRNYVRDNMASAKGRSFLPAAGKWKKANTFGDPKKTHCSKPTR
ncbi:hypothetical protein WIW50_17575 [Flavobacteriaceae bacterium 3-367]|uniref:hypothetical protein n=1 Tax=Eudoraea algarum TaxID=3417568 RepID=UPI00327A2DC3